MMRGRRRKARSAGIVVGIAVLAVWVAWTVNLFVNPPSALGTGELLAFLASLVAISGLLIWLLLSLRGLQEVSTEYQRFGVTGIVLLVIGAAIALHLLPEGSSMGAVAGTVSVLPPFSTKAGQEFMVGLAAHPHGCRDPVEVTMVANGTERYWAAHATRGKLPFVFILPGEYAKRSVSVRLGYPRSAGSDAVSYPERASPDTKARGSEVRWETTPSHKLTILTGLVTGWAESRRPVIVTIEAPWVTHRGPDTCNLELPALMGAPSAAEVATVFSCGELDRHYPGSCLDPPSARNAVSDVYPSQYVSRAVSVVSGSEFSATESSPPPKEVGEDMGWKCSAIPAAAVPVASGAEVPGASGSSQSDCNAVAVIHVSDWHRDFLIVLIGAFFAVGVHMMFEAMVDHNKERRAAPPKARA
jgi:hypothetical protein